MVAYLLLLAVVVLSPSSGLQSATVYEGSTLLLRLGLPYELVGYGRAEMLANALMVVPAGVLGMVVFPRSRWQDWAAYGFLGALAVELTQGLLLPQRSPSATDVVANAVGMLAGALLVRLVRRRGARSAG